MNLAGNGGSSQLLPGLIELLPNPPAPFPTREGGDSPRRGRPPRREKIAAPASPLVGGIEGGLIPGNHSSHQISLDNPIACVCEALTGDLGGRVN